MPIMAKLAGGAGGPGGEGGFPGGASNTDKGPNNSLCCYWAQYEDFIFKRNISFNNE